MKHVLHRILLFTIATVLTIASYAQRIEFEGLNYILDETKKTAAVTYQGDNPEENNYKGEIEIPTKFDYNDVTYRVTSIGEKAFYGCDSIVYINIGGLITEIGSEAFGNSGMSSLIIPEDVTAIADDAFKGSNISLFMLGSFENYSFLNCLSVTTPVFAYEETIEAIKEVWSGDAKDITTPYYMEILSTITTIAFRLHKTEYYSLPNGPYFEFSSVIVDAQGSGITPDPETGIYLCDGLAPGDSKHFVINFNIDGFDDSRSLILSAKQPTVECKDVDNTATSFFATIVAEEENAFVSLERGVYINGTKYKADENCKVEVNNLTEDTEYTVKPYAVYKSKTYYGTQFTFKTNASTGIAGVAAGSEPVVSLSNKTRSGYLEVSVNCNGDATYSIVNITGQKEKEGTISGENKTNSISTVELSSGIYLINVNGANVNKTMKFVIK